MKYIALSGVYMALILMGCATSSQTYGPDGKIAHSIDCSGLARSWGMCLEKAGEICGARGYDIQSATTDNGTVVSANPQLLFGGTTITRSMLINCK